MAMTLEEFIAERRKSIEAHIRRQVPNIECIDTEECEDWILNDEYLYNWALEEGVDFEQ